MTRSFILCFAAALMLAAPAAAQNAMPALRASATVSGDIVRIGDLIENSGPVANIPIFRAPDLGTRGTVPTAKVVEAIRPHQLIGIDTRGLNEVVVIRATREILPTQISARIAKALEGQYGLGAAHNIQVEFDREPRTLNIEPTSTGELQVVSLAYNSRSGHFDVTLDLPTSAAMRNLTTRFTGIATETIDAVSVDHLLERGEVLKASDLVIARRPKSEGPAITDIHAAAGLAARHQLRPGQPLHEADLMKPLIVQRNEPVTIIYEAPGISLTLRGQAQDAGALGDTISVANAESKRVVQGVVSGPGRVTASSPHIRFVENAEPPSAAAVPSLFETQQHEHSVE
ncbi:MAG TPA: flagellar basal body P-ring formation chaperone FlgA [Xanthobacteraceae bacterium]|nr:flagellar basal body P-ring formation chaperone FlgA [Xanthobacteraceae bacterium]